MKKGKKWYSKPVSWALIISIVLNVILFVAFTNVYYDKDILQQKLAKIQSTESTKESVSDPDNLLSDKQKQLIQDEQKEDKNSKTFNIGETVEFNNGYKVTVNSIKEDNNHKLSDNNAGLKPVIVNITVENTTNEPVSFNSQSFSLYDKNDIITDHDSTTYSNNIPNNIAANKKAIVDIIYASKNSGPFSVSLGDVLWEEK